MKKTNFKRALIVALIGMFFCFFVQTCFSQTSYYKAEQATVVEQKMNAAKVKDAFSKRKSFLVAGDVFGFAVWVLLLLNTIFFLSAAIIAWRFIRCHRAYPRELVHRVKTVLDSGDLGFAMDACSPCHTPLSRILFSAFKNIADGFEVCKEEMHIALKAEYERMLKTARLLLNCAVYSIVLGLLGCGIILVRALREFSENAAISNWQDLAFLSSQSLYPLMAGLVIAYIAFWFYQYCQGKINRIIINTEKIAYDLIKVMRGVHLDDDLQELATMTRLLDPKTIISLSKNKILSQKKEDKPKEAK